MVSARSRDLIIVDEQDEWLLFDYNWTCTEHGYVVRSVELFGVWTPTYLHHYIMGQPIWEGDVIDHINHNGYDNRRSNMRYVTHQQNLLNARHPVGVTGVRGVTPHYSGKYVAQIKRHGVNHYVGIYDTVEEAFKARETYIREGNHGWN
jgi:hypothetical protein